MKILKNLQGLGDSMKICPSGYQGLFIVFFLPNDSCHGSLFNFLLLLEGSFFFVRPPPPGTKFREPTGFYSEDENFEKVPGPAEVV